MGGLLSLYFRESNAGIFEYDVFLSFRGADSRVRFVRWLIEALRRQGIKVFVDVDIEKGDQISLSLAKAIKGSRISIVVLSERYAFSKWCLEELVMILECMNLRGQLVLPVFYEVKPSSIRNQTGSYGEGMTHQEKKFKDFKDKVKQWRSALTAVANINGWEVKGDKYECTCIEEIVKTVCSRLNVPILLETQFSKEEELIFFGDSSRFPGLKNSLDELKSLEQKNFNHLYVITLKSGKKVGVKLFNGMALSNESFKKKMKAIGIMKNEYLVPLRAYYFTRELRILCYDFMRGESLYKRLHGGGDGPKLLDWEKRYYIALGAARGIAKIHSHGSHMCHGNIKSRNIFLTKSYEPRLSDYCVADLSDLSTTLTAGNNYCAPEVTEFGQLSHKSDVYSFGVLLLELITGQHPVLLNPVTCEKLCTGYYGNVRGFIYYNLRKYDTNKMTQLLRLALACVNSTPDKRPAMGLVIESIEITGCKKGEQDDYLSTDGRFYLMRERYILNRYGYQEQEHGESEVRLGRERLRRL